MMKWPPRSQDLTPLDFYFWGYVKGKAYIPPLTQTIDELQIRIRAGNVESGHGQSVEELITDNIQDGDAIVFTDESVKRGGKSG